MTVGIVLGEGAHGLWNPTIIGVLTVLSAVGLFCGSAYLLLATNLGGRLGFLVAAAGLSGFLVLLTTLWITTPGSATGNSDLDPPHGPLASWKVVDITSSPPASKINGVHEIQQKGKALSEDQLTNLKPAIDSALVPAAPVAGQTPPAQPFATITAIKGSTDYLLNFSGYQSYGIGGHPKNWFWHTPRYAVVEFCIARKDATGSNVIPPTCDPLQPVQYAVLSYDLGSIREPVVAYWVASLILFALSLLGLHWWEQDERARKRAALASGPVPVPSS